MCELGCPSLDYVYDMSWREFQLRKMGYDRKEKIEWEKVRQIAYWSGVEVGFDRSKYSPQKFMPLDDKEQSKGVSEEAQARFKKAQKEYKEKVKNGNK